MANETVESVNEDVERNFATHCRVANTTEVINTLLPVEKIKVDKIFALLNGKHYIDGRWNGFPTAGSAHREDDHPCLPFVNVANAIHEAARQVESLDHALDHESTRWVDRHFTVSKPQDSDAAQIYPDCVFALNQVKAYIDKIQAQKDEAEEAKTNSKTALSWPQIIAIVKMKDSASDKWQDIVKQLIGHLRRVLREQLDRRFVMGFTMGNSRLSLWLHDRSGVLRTADPIDIHKEPEKFIQVIAGFSILSAAKLGYDPAMKLCFSSDSISPSYRLGSLQVENAYRGGPYDRKGTLVVNDGKKYPTVRASSLARAGEMRGRGTLAWGVIPHGQDKEAQKICVLKQFLAPKSVLREGELYEAAKSEYVGAMEKRTGVLVEGVEDDTESLIVKKNLVPPSPAEASFFVVGSRDPIARVRTRVLLSTYGWPLKCFNTLRELVEVLQDAIKGHQDLFSHGVLHRDISTGNIVIQWPQPDGDEADSDNASQSKSAAILQLRGRLIDLDRAARGKSKTLNHPIIEVKALDKDAKDVFKQSLIAQLQQRIPSLKDLNCQEDFLSSLFTGKLRIEYGLDAIEHGLKFGHIVDGGICSFETLSWKQTQVNYDFDFESHEVQKGSRTRTPPFTSGEILSGSRYFPAKRTRRFQLRHHAVHDLESFFWVLVHICLTRSGPGGQRRIELTTQAEKGATEHSVLRGVVWCFFEGDMESLQANKQEIFKNPNDFDEIILDNFHPYFNPLKGLISEWFGLLGLAYEYRSYEWENIHDRVISVLEKTIRQFGSAADHYATMDAATTKVLEMRQRDIERLTTASTLPSHSTIATVHHQHLEQADENLWETSPPSQNFQQGSQYNARPPDSPTPRTKNVKHQSSFSP